jgi:hypothetical protein
MGIHISKMIPIKNSNTLHAGITIQQVYNSSLLSDCSSRDSCSYTQLQLYMVSSIDNAFQLQHCALYMGHFINNTQGGKTAEWLMQSQ